MKFPRNTLHPILQKYHREIPQLCSDHHRSNTHIQSLLVKLQEDAFQDEHPQEEPGQEGVLSWKVLGGEEREGEEHGGGEHGGGQVEGADHPREEEVGHLEVRFLLSPH